MEESLNLGNNNLNLAGELRKRFEIKEVDIRTYSPLTLAFIGDSVYELIIRSIVTEKCNKPANILNKEKVHYVNAASQAHIADSIADKLTDEGVKNISIKLTGWCNGGVNQKILTRVHLINDLGSKKDLRELSQTAKDLGVDLYLDGITQYAHRSNIFNGFFSYRDAARLLTKERAELYRFSHITYKAREGFKSYYLLHTPLALKMANNLVDTAVKYGTGVSFQDIGMDLSSDFYRKDYHSRENAKLLNEELLKTLDDRGAKLMINMGNDYAIPYADVVTSMDLKGSGYTVIDSEVPFYQIAVHGYINYTGDPINILHLYERKLICTPEDLISRVLRM